MFSSLHHKRVDLSHPKHSSISLSKKPLLLEDWYQGHKPVKVVWASLREHNKMVISYLAGICNIKDGSKLQLLHAYPCATVYKYTYVHLNRDEVICYKTPHHGQLANLQIWRWNIQRGSKINMAFLQHRIKKEKEPTFDGNHFSAMAMDIHPFPQPSSATVLSLKIESGCRFSPS